MSKYNKNLVKGTKVAGGLINIPSLPIIMSVVASGAIGPNALNRGPTGPTGPGPNKEWLDASGQLKELDIKWGDPTDILDLLNDNERLKEVLRKLNMKAFW